MVLFYLIFNKKHTKEYRKSSSR